MRNDESARALESAAVIRAVFWDFGGVILTSPFDAFNQYELAKGLPADFIRSVNTRDPDTNAWARFERREVSATEFDVLFADESESHGHRVAGSHVIFRPKRRAMFPRWQAVAVRWPISTSQIGSFRDAMHSRKSRW